MRRRGRTVRTGGRGGSAPTATRARPEQQVAREGSIWSRKGHGRLLSRGKQEGAQLDGSGADGAVER
jgi:hypothetical protein